MPFDKIKQQYLKELQENNLGHKDKSEKGFVDEEIKDLITLINNNDNYYTTSSCSGRTAIICLSNGNQKNKSAWLFSSHNLVKNIDKTIINKMKGNCWLKFEPFIIHVCCKNIASALHFIELAKHVGFKRGGITSIREEDRVIVEVCGVDKLEVPLANDKGLLITEDYLQFLIGQCNRKMERNNLRIKQFYNLLVEA